MKKCLRGVKVRLLILGCFLCCISACNQVKQEPCGSVGLPGFDRGYPKDDYGISTYWGPNNIHCAPTETQEEAKKHHPDWFEK